MKNYVFIYYSNQSMAEEPDAATMEAVKKTWMDWFGSLGDKLVDGGNPFNAGAQAVSKNGVMDVKDNPATGYSIVKAGSMDDATNIAKGCPVLEAPGGAVCVYETLPM